ncbi:MAG: 16S rRNA (guanine(527)-N(7))-methyltransferase RsmG [Acidobacteriota bacterium]|nr:16S rRNA (guanine(527)-N(7))-methyltransferase RsmG [Acidobacteriota bacterium]
MRERFIKALEEHQNFFDLRLGGEQIRRLADYYELVEAHNELLHLVAPAPAEEFAVRHILESLTLLKFLPEQPQPQPQPRHQAKLADVGTGAGLPSLPCLLAREDLGVFLIESKIKKARFLEEALSKFNLAGRARILNRQFEEIEKPADADFVTCRALDKFIQKLPKLLKWSKGSRMLLFGGNSLRDELKKHNVKFGERLMPLSEQRFLFYTDKI